MATKIFIYEPHKATNQKKYVVDCLDTNMLTFRGKYVEQFEQKISETLKIKHTISTFNGSVSLMLILYGLGIGYKDEVIVPSLTYAATVSSINLMGATAVLVDSDDNLQMDLSKIEKIITKKTKAIMVPELYSDCPDLNKLISICKKHKILLIEDSAESFGSKFKNKYIGSFGIASSFSYFANKLIQTGEGGCVCTNDDTLAKKLRLLKNQSHIGNFMHSGPGFNFRMTNLQAAIGCAQLEQYDWVLTRKKEIAKFYRENLHSEIIRVVPRTDSSEWMPLFRLPNSITYPRFQILMQDAGIETRPAFAPVHIMEGFNIKTPVSLSNSERIYKSGFNLPCYPDLNKKQLNYIVDTVNKIIETRD